MSYFKTDLEVLDYDINYAAVMVAGEEIDSSSWDVILGDGMLVMDSDIYSASATKVWLSGGTIGEVYYVQNTIITDDARTYQRGFYLNVEQTRS
jgi:hypothetical protein